MTAPDPSHVPFNCVKWSRNMYDTYRDVPERRKAFLAIADELDRKDSEIAGIKDRTAEYFHTLKQAEELGFKNVGQALQHLDSLQRRCGKAEALLGVANCPNCDGSGAIIVETTGMEPGCCGRPNRDGSCCGNPVPIQTQEQEQQPCQWCDERAAALAGAPDNGDGG